MVLDFLVWGTLSSFLRPQIDIGNFFVVCIASKAECFFCLLDSKYQGSLSLLEGALVIRIILHWGRCWVPDSQSELHCFMTLNLEVLIPSFPWN